MAFPITGIIDNFGRADEGPPMTGWTDITNGLVVNTLQCTGSVVAENTSRFNTLYFENQEAYVTVATRQLNLNVCVVYSRYQNAINWIGLLITRDDTLGDTVEIYEYVAGAPALLDGPYAITYQDGDSFGIQDIGTGIEAWYKPVAGVWGSLGSGVTTLPLADGYIGLLAPDTTIRFDNFGGGEITVSTSISVSVSPSGSTSPSGSISPSGSKSPSVSPSGSASPSGSISPSGSVSPSGSISLSVSPSGSTSPSGSISPSGSVSPSASQTASVSPSSSVSPSGSISKSASPSGSISLSISPSGSLSQSPSVSGSPSSSRSPSASYSRSPSPSASFSPSASSSPSGSASASASPSPAPVEIPACSSLDFANILDDFNRAAGPIGTDWTNQSGTMVVVGNRCGASASPALCTYNGTFTNGLVYATLIVRQSNLNISHLIARYVDGNNFLDLSIFRDDGGNDTLELYQIIGGVSHVVAGPFVIALQSGDSFGLKCFNAITEVWYKPLAGAWTLLGSGNTLKRSGYPGLGLPDATGRWDDFGGCDLRGWTPAPSAPGCAFKNGYRIITPDGETFDFASPGFCVSVGIPDGLGMPPITHNTKVVYGMPGAYLEAIDVLPRVVTITATMHARDRAQLHALRHKLFGALRWNRTLVNPPEPAQLIYEVDGVVVRLYVHYLSDVISNVNVNDDRAQLVGVRLVAYDPIWYSTAVTTTDLNMTKTFLANYIAGRIGGVWQTFGTGTGGISPQVFSIAVNPTNNNLVIGGTFTTANGVVVNGIAEWNGTTFIPFGTGVAGGAALVRAISFDPSGQMIIGGWFTSANGVLANGIARWNGITFVPYGTGVAGGIGHSDVNSIAIDSTGTIFIGGRFATANGVAALNIAYWTGVTFAPLGTGADADVFAMVFGPDGSLYITGSFLNANAVLVNGIAKWNGTTFEAFGTGFGGIAPDSGFAIALTKSGNLIVGGDFFVANGIAATGIAMWNGVAFDYSMGGVNGLTQTVYSIILDDDGSIIIGGNFSDAGGATNTYQKAVWNGTAWAQLPATIPGLVYAMAIHDGDLYLGFDSAGNITAASETFVLMLGTFDASPVLTITGPGTLEWIENATTGKRMIFNCYINAGETVTIDPKAATFTSDWRGDMFPYAALLPQSDFADFTLAPDPIAPLGINTIAVYMTGTTAASSASESHYDAFLTADDAVYSND